MRLRKPFNQPKTPRRYCSLFACFPVLRSAGLAIALTTLLVLGACDAEIRKSDAELGLTPQQSAGRRIYDDNCDRCHAPYSSSGRRGPSLKGVFKKQYLAMSGMPANNDRVTDVIRLGREKMPGFGQVLNQPQIDDLLEYLHTL